MCLPAIPLPPEEEPWCEWCGHYFEWCSCFEDIQFEEEEDALDVV